MNEKISKKKGKTARQEPTTTTDRRRDGNANAEKLRGDV